MYLYILFDGSEVTNRQSRERPLKELTRCRLMSSSVLQLIHCSSVICDRLFWRAASSIRRRHPDVHCSLEGRPQGEHRHTRKVYHRRTSVVTAQRPAAESQQVRGDSVHSC